MDIGEINHILILDNSISEVINNYSFKLSKLIIKWIYYRDALSLISNKEDEKDEKGINKNQI